MAQTGGSALFKKKTTWRRCGGVVCTGRDEEGGGSPEAEAFETDRGHDGEGGRGSIQESGIAEAGEVVVDEAEARVASGGEWSLEAFKAGPEIRRGPRVGPNDEGDMSVVVSIQNFEVVVVVVVVGGVGLVRRRRRLGRLRMAAARR